MYPSSTFERLALIREELPDYDTALPVPPQLSFKKKTKEKKDQRSQPKAVKTENDRKKTGRSGKTITKINLYASLLFVFMSCMASAQGVLTPFEEWTTQEGTQHLFYHSKTGNGCSRMV